MRSQGRNLGGGSFGDPGSRSLKGLQKKKEKGKEAREKNIKGKERQKEKKKGKGKST